MIKQLSEKQKNGIYDGRQTIPTIYATPLGNKYLVNITNDFDTADSYDDIVALLSNATEADEIVWNISSYGGFVSSLQMLLGWKSMCPARHTHVLHSNADSCASVFFLSDAHQYIVGDGATMFCHEIQSGVSGTTSNVVRHAEHLKEQNDKFIRKSYENFLDESQIDDLLKGVEVFLSSDEIRERLAKREEVYKQQSDTFIQQMLEAEDDLSEYSTEDLQEEFDLLKAELAKRKKMKLKETSTKDVTSK